MNNPQLEILVLQGSLLGGVLSKLLYQPFRYWKGTVECPTIVHRNVAVVFATLVERMHEGGENAPEQIFTLAWVDAFRAGPEAGTGGQITQQLRFHRYLIAHVHAWREGLLDGLVQGLCLRIDA